MAGSAVTLIRPHQTPPHSPYTSHQGASVALDTSHRSHGFVLTATTSTSAVMEGDTRIPIRTNSTIDSNNNTTNNNITSWEEPPPQQQCHNDDNNDDDEVTTALRRRPRSGSEGLDCLAALAEQERQAMRRSEELMMPPPRPRRPRSVSNPEDMIMLRPRSHYENATTTSSRCANYHRRRCLVLPASILEEELAEVNAAVQQNSILVATAGQEDTDDDDEVTILTNARARILEDVLEECRGDKGDTLVLPHTLIKYKELYNRCGRVGIYTLTERAAILARFHDKRTRRNWQKKIRYNCRKSLADSRVRIKGRFVKRATEQEQEQLLLVARRGGDVDDDDDMPDVNDPEAGFCPTEDQPYRRFRRHTVT